VKYVLDSSVALKWVLPDDCLYVALAEHTQCEFVTSDDRLVRKLAAKFPFIRTLSTFP
jgi:hypothetical protein